MFREQRSFRGILPAIGVTVFALSLSVIPNTAFSVQKITAGATCSKLNIKATANDKIYTCIKKGNKLIWNSGVLIKTAAPAATPAPSPVASPTPSEAPKATPTPTPSSTPSPSTAGTPSSSPSPTPTPQVTLPANNSLCTKIGEKIISGTKYARCSWAGHANSTEEAVQRLVWRYGTVTELSTSKSNNYVVTPKESASCTRSGDTFEVSGGILECRWVKGRNLQWIRINTVKQSFVNAKSPVSIDVCKLQNSDMTVKRGERDATQYSGFPLPKPDYMNVKGTNEVLIVPVDFPDFPGGSELKAQLDYDIKWLVDWYTYFSGGQNKFNVTTSNTWIRLPKNRSEYPTDEKSKDALGATSNNRQALQAQAFIDEVTKYFDLRKYSTVYLFFPDGNYAQGDLIVRNQTFNIKEGKVILNFFSWGRNLEGMETLKWAYYIHETLHDLKINGHAPGNGWPLGIMQTQSGISYAMNPWEQFLLDWLPADQIYCDDFKSLKTATVSLSPVEREDKQTKMAVIKLSPTKAIVIESHGIDKWSDFKFGDREFPPGFYSIMAYVVDLDKTVAPPVNSDGSSISNDDWAWAVWQKVDSPSSSVYRLQVGSGKDLSDYVAVLGDTFTIEGVKIKFVGTGDYETIEISKA